MTDRDLLANSMRWIYNNTDISWAKNSKPEIIVPDCVTMISEIHGITIKYLADTLVSMEEVGGIYVVLVDRLLPKK
ncbi:hypothetical protein FV242_34110 [Methylobacterium sp. WL64]|uniref:hypothetical protein n=1 Tax=Methylobacterium sp. WL64 TaxID=2603894 RepID=UPI0011C8F0C2|nr:hypothetical protein [Methylobacterium sp. WL64]TXM95950.1 hypothetical protein FV242_34110 [Methylobacterium sp. WL64]